MDVRLDCYADTTTNSTECLRLHWEGRRTLLKRYDRDQARHGFPWRAIYNLSFAIILLQLFSSYIKLSYFSHQFLLNGPLMISTWLAIRFISDGMDQRSVHFHFQGSFAIFNLGSSTISGFKYTRNRSSCYDWQQEHFHHPVASTSLT